MRYSSYKKRRAEIIWWLGWLTATIAWYPDMCNVWLLRSQLLLFVRVWSTKARPRLASLQNSLVDETCRFVKSAEAIWFKHVVPLEQCLSSYSFPCWGLEPCVCCGLLQFYFPCLIQTNSGSQLNFDLPFTAPNQVKYTRYFLADHKPPDSDC